VRNCDKKGAKESDFTLVEYRHRIKLDLWRSVLKSENEGTRNDCAEFSLESESNDHLLLGHVAASHEQIPITVSALHRL